MAVAEAAYKSSISISNISKSVTSFRKGIAQQQTSVANVNTILLKKTRFKRQSIAADRIVFAKRREAVRRREQEDIIESSGISGAIKRQNKVIASSTKGFLGRIMDFVGTLMIGWLVNNLPLIIKMGEQVIQRIQKLVFTLRGFVSGITQILSGFGSLLGGVFSDLVRFNFSNIGKDISTSMNQMTSGFDMMERSIDDAFDVLREPFDFEEPEIPQGGVLPVEGQPTPSAESPTGPETTSGGKVLNAQSGYSYLKQLGISDIHALGILANIKGESGFRIDSQQPDGPGVGLFQYSSTGRKQAFLKNVPDWKTNWKAQINYAISEDRGPEYIKTQFSSPEEAADWWMNNWERPDPGVKSDRRKKHNSFIKSFKPGTTSPAQTTPSKTSSVPAVTTSVQDQFKGQPGGSAGQITGVFGEQRKGHKHAGIDIAPAGPGYYVAFKQSGTVTYAQFNNGGYGNLVIIKVGNTEYYFAHLAKIFVKNGQKYNGQTIGEIGSTGGSTGIHLHFEVRPNGKPIDPRPYIGMLSIGKQLVGVAGQPTTATLTSAQISTPPSEATQQMRSMTPQRTGPTVMVSQQQTPQVPVSFGGGGGQSIPEVSSDGNELNRFMVQRLLLELAYT